MLEAFEHRGLWWLPEEPEQQIAGVLTFSQDESALELIGQLPRDEPTPDKEEGNVGLANVARSRDRILGLSTDGKRFTLECCRATALSMSFPGIVTERFGPSLILEGAHYEPGEAVLFDELLVRYTQFDAWVATTGLSRSFVFNGEEPTGIDFSFRPPEAVEIELPDTDVEIAFSWTIHDSAPLRAEVSLSQRAAFTLRFHEPTPLERALDFVYQLRNFVALGVGRPVTPVEIKGFVLPPTGAEPDKFTGTQPRKLKINIFYQLAHIPEVKDVHPAQMLFTLADARDRFQSLLANWFAKQELLGPMFDLYFGAVYNRHAFLQQRFLSLMQAIETYHRRTSTETELPAEEHGRRLDEILAATPVQYRDWLEGELTYSNELVLRKRLDDVLTRCPLVVKKLVKKSFPHHVGTTRNYLTHYDPSLEKKAAKGPALHALTVQLHALVEMCLLLELGFSCDEIDGFFERVRRYEKARP